MRLRISCWPIAALGLKPCCAQIWPLEHFLGMNYGMLDRKFSITVCGASVTVRIWSGHSQCKGRARHLCDQCMR